jgi:hypothetical protein
MDEKEIFELYKNLKRGFDTSNWDLIQESIDYLSEYIELDDDDEMFDVIFVVVINNAKYFFSGVFKKGIHSN